MPDGINLGNFRTVTMRDDGSRLVVSGDQDKLTKTTNRVADFFRRIFQGSARREENVRTVRSFKAELVRQYGEDRVTPAIRQRLDRMITGGKSLRTGVVRNVLSQLEQGTRAPTRCGDVFSAVSGKKPDMTAFLRAVTAMAAGLQTGQNGTLLSTAEVFARAMDLLRTDLQGLSPGALLQLVNGLNSPEFLDTREALNRFIDDLGGVSSKGPLGLQEDKFAGDVRRLLEALDEALQAEIESRGMPNPAMKPFVAPNVPIPNADQGAIALLTDAVTRNAQARIDIMGTSLLSCAIGGGNTLNNLVAQLKSMRTACLLSLVNANRQMFGNTFGDTLNAQIRKMHAENPAMAAKLAMFASSCKNNPDLMGRLDGMKNPPPPLPGLSEQERRDFESVAAEKRTLALDIEDLISYIDETLDIGEGRRLELLNSQEFERTNLIPDLPIDASNPGGPRIGDADAEALGRVFSHQFVRDVRRTPITFNGAPLTGDLASLQRLRNAMIAKNGGDAVKADQELRNLTRVLSQSLERGFLESVTGRPEGIPVYGTGEVLDRSFEFKILDDGSFEVNTLLRQSVLVVTDLQGNLMLDGDESAVTSTASYVISAGTGGDGEIGVVLTRASVTLKAVPSDPADLLTIPPREYRVAYP